MAKIVSLRSVFIAATLIVSVCNLASAHHSGAEFDLDHPRTLEGTVKTVNWTNPHIFFVVESDAKDGEPAQTWTFQAASPGVLSFWGWTKSSLQPGDHAVFDYAPLRDSSPGGYLLRVTLPTGKELRFRFDIPLQHLRPGTPAHQ